MAFVLVCSSACFPERSLFFCILCHMRTRREPGWGQVYVVYTHLLSFFVLGLCFGFVLLLVLFWFVACFGFVFCYGVVLFFLALDVLVVHYKHIDVD